MRLDKIHQIYEDGRMDITAEAISVFRIHEVEEKMGDKLYSGAMVEPFIFDIKHDSSLNTEIILKIEQLFKALQIQKELPNADQVLSYNVAHLIGLSLEQEYELLQIRDEFSRQHYILNHLNQIIPLAQRMESIRNKAQMNGHFREFDQLEF
jgi:Lon protease-like protein